MADSPAEWWQVIAADPNLRPICADWFEERGDPRAPLLRALIETEKLGKKQPDYEKLDAVYAPVNQALRDITGDDTAHYGTAPNTPDQATLTIPKAKPPALPEESDCFTYTKDLLKLFDRSKHAKETFHDQCTKPSQS